MEINNDTNRQTQRRLSTPLVIISVLIILGSLLILSFRHRSPDVYNFVKDIGTYSPDSFVMRVISKDEKIILIEDNDIKRDFLNVTKNTDINERGPSHYYQIYFYIKLEFGDHELRFTIMKDFGKSKTRIILEGQNHFDGYTVDSNGIFESIYEMLIDSK